MTGEFLSDAFKEAEARHLAGRLLGDGVIDTWPADQVYEYLEADGYIWLSSGWFPCCDSYFETSATFPGGEA